jgi:predicted RNase H-like nuclease
MADPKSHWRLDLAANRPGLPCGGIDGRRGGWVLAAWDGREVTFRFLDHLEGEGLEEFALIAIDIPLGLPPQGRRLCDKEASRLPGVVSSSVFPVPPRGVVWGGRDYETYQECLSRCREVTGKGVSVQTFNILPKIREADRWVRSLDYPERVLEVHPEAVFAGLAGKMRLSSKKTIEGLEERRSLLPPALSAAWDGMAWKKTPSLAQPDDVMDALGALDAAIRATVGQAKEVPLEWDLDEEGLPMRIVY